MCDATKGAYGRFVRSPAGKAVPPQTHSNGYHAVVIAGAMMILMGDEAEAPEEGASGPEYAAGSYHFVPGRVIHVTRCVSDVECIWYEHSEGASDISFVQ